MGLMDILNGMQNGPGGQRQPAPAGGGGGMPTWMMALLGLLAYKAVKGGGLGNILGGGSQSPNAPAPNPRGGYAGAPGGGGLGDILGGMLGGGGRTAAPGGGGLGGLLGGLLGGAAAGSVLNGGLKNLVQDMESNGQGGAARSWISHGDNQSISPNELGNAIGLDDVDAVSQQTGMPRDQLLSELSQHLPNFVDQLTPDGRLPTDNEASRWV
jgi:uncharacterized protein YidB (DUF937 family)